MLTRINSYLQSSGSGTTVTTTPAGRSIANVTYSMVAKTGGYVFEARIPWATLQSRKDIDEALLSYEQNIGIRLFLAKNIERNENGVFELKCNINAIEHAYPEIIGALHFSQTNNIPTLFILGENSNYLKEEDKPYIESYFKNVIYQNVSKAGHWLHADNPSEFLEKLNSFL